MMKKVAIIYDLTELGGVQTCVFSLVKGLNRIGITPVLFWDRPPLASAIEELKLKLDYSKLRFPIPTSCLKKLPATLRYELGPFNMIGISSIPEEFDFVYIFTPIIKIDTDRPHLFYLSGPPLLPQLESVHLKFRIAKSIYKNFIEKYHPAYIPQKNAHYVINSKYTAKMYREAHGNEPEVVYPSNQLDFSADGPYDPAHRKYTTFFSRIMKYKRPEMIIDLAARHPDNEFVIMGGVGPKRVKYFNRLRTDADSRGIRNLRFIGNASKEEVDRILGRTLFYVFPAVNEHFGITTVEAVLKGCIPLVHNSGGQREIVPLAELRFEDDELDQKYDRLTSMPADKLSEIMVRMKEHIVSFSEENYISRMISFLNSEKYNRTVNVKRNEI